MRIIIIKHILLIIVTLLSVNVLKSQVDSSDINKDFKKPTIDSASFNTMALLFIGDLMAHDAQIESAYNPESNSYDFSDVFKYIKDELSEPDFAVANFEVTLAGPPYKGFPLFSSPDELPIAAKENGIDVLVTANNHCCDRRLPGINRTIDVLDSLEIKHTGTFKNSNDSLKDNLLILEKDSIKVGILNYTFGTNGMPIPGPSLVNLIDRTLIKADINSAKLVNLDKLIVFLHFGSEYQSQPNAFQTDLVNFLFDNKVDIVIGSHPHVIQKMIYLAGNENNNEQFAAYSLGNFVSNQRKPRTDGGVMAKLVLKKENGKTVIDESNYILTWVYKKHRIDDLYDYYILPAGKFEENKAFFTDPSDFEMMKLFLKDSRTLLNMENVNVEEYNFEEPENSKTDD